MDKELKSKYISAIEKIRDLRDQAITDIAIATGGANEMPLSKELTLWLFDDKFEGQSILKTRDGLALHCKCGQNMLLSDIDDLTLIHIAESV